MEMRFLNIIKLILSLLFPCLLTPNLTYSYLFCFSVVSVLMALSSAFGEKLV